MNRAESSSSCFTGSSIFTASETMVGAFLMRGMTCPFVNPQSVPGCGKSRAQRVAPARLVARRGTSRRPTYGMSFFPASPPFLRLGTRSRRLQQFRRKLDVMVSVLRWKFFPHLLLGRSTCFPCVVEMLEPRSREPFFRLIPKDEVRLRQRSVLSQVPGLPDEEVTQQIRHRVRTDWNRDERIEQFPRSAKMPAAARHIKKPKRR